MSRDNVYEYIGGPWDGRVEASPDDESLAVFAFNRNTLTHEIAGYYRPAGGEHRGKMVWHPIGEEES